MESPISRAHALTVAPCVPAKPNKVYIMYVGGTIGMQRTEKGYQPVANYLREQIMDMPEFRDPRMPDFDINEYNPLLDSSDMNTDDWIKIASDLQANYDKYCGFVIVHGTDTMAYTASALSFMLENLGKIVVLTGAQIPLSELRNDGRYNLISAVMIAGNFSIPEVCIFFDRKLLRGNRSKKVDIWGLKPFDSLNYAPLATVGIDICVHTANVLPAPQKPLSVWLNLSSDIVALRIFPGFSAHVFKEMLNGTHIKAIVLEAYGSGNLPEKKRSFLDVISDHVERGVVVVIVSQVTRGSVNMDQYATGQALKSIGVISGYDMTIEAALTKLQYLFGKGYSAEKVKELMQVSLAGELTPLQNFHKQNTRTTKQDQLEPTVGVINNNSSSGGDHLGVPANEAVMQYHATFQYSRPVTLTASTAIASSNNPTEGVQ